MISLEPETQITDVRPGIFIYRGFSSKDEFARAQSSGFSPEKPLESTAEAIALFQRDMPVEHIMERKKRVFVSFSFQLEVAIYYATTNKRGEKHDGYVAKARLPEHLKQVSVGRFPCAYSGNNATGNNPTEWIDPRHFVPEKADNLRQREEMLSRARCDDEFLLAKGRVFPICVKPVKASECDSVFLPWSKWGEKINIGGEYHDKAIEDS